MVAGVCRKALAYMIYRLPVCRRSPWWRGLAAIRDSYILMAKGSASPTSSGSLSPVNTVLEELPVRALATWFMASFFMEQAGKKDKAEQDKAAN